MLSCWHSVPGCCCCCCFGRTLRCSSGLFPNCVTFFPETSFFLPSQKRAGFLGLTLYLLCEETKVSRLVTTEHEPEFFFLPMPLWLAASCTVGTKCPSGVKFSALNPAYIQERESVLVEGEMYQSESSVLTLTLLSVQRLETCCHF